MTTSDDDPRLAGDEQPLAETTHADPLSGDPLYTEPLAPVDAEPPKARWPLAILAGLGTGLLGVVLWAFVFMQFDREYVGVAVIIGLVVGWVIRTVSRRSTVAARVAAVLITAVTCVLGTVIGEVAYTAKFYDADFGKLLGDVLPDTFNVVKDRPAVTLGIFVVALVLAWLSAGPQKEKPKKQRASASTLPPAPAPDPQDGSQLPPG